jgi:hypothetical protein
MTEDGTGMSRNNSEHLVLEFEHLKPELRTFELEKEDKLLQIATDVRIKGEVAKAL